MAHVENILSLIPQQPPFVMIDRLLVSDVSITRSSFIVAADNVLTINGEFTEAGLMENIAQTAAARAGLSAVMQNRSVAAGYIASVTHFEVFTLPGINNELITEVTTDDSVPTVTVIWGTVHCNEELIAKCEMKVLMA